MKVSTTIPILLLPFALAHAHGIAPAHQIGRRNNSLRNGYPRSDRYNLEGRQHSAGLLGDLVDGGESTSTTLRTSSTSTRSTISPTITSSSSSSSSLTTDKETDEDTTVEVTSRTTSTVSGLETTTPSGSITHSSGVSGSISASSSITSSANITSVANSTSVVTATSSETPSSSSQSFAASVQYTTDAAGQTQLVTVILTAAAATAAESTASVTSSAKPKDDGDTIPVAAIIGISVGAGVVVILLIAFAVWRMKRKNGDEDEAIRWPELNRHGDSDAHHALPARQTGQHGFETNPLSRSLSNSSSIFAPSNVQSNNNDYGSSHGGPQPMALNGSSFGASSSLEDINNNNYSNEKLSVGGDHNHSATQSHDDHDNYTSLPPPVQPELNYDYSTHGNDSDDDPYGGMTMINNQHVTTGLPNPHSDQSHQARPNFRLD